jgi:hypothetical protein
LAGGARNDCSGQNAIVTPYTKVACKCGIPNQSADAQSALRGWLDLVQTKILKVDKMAGRFDLQLHQIEEVGAASDKFGARLLSHNQCRMGGAFGALIGEGFHALAPETSAHETAAPETSVIACAILE